jgi:hypothetical protein
MGIRPFIIHINLGGVLKITPGRWIMDNLASKKTLVDALDKLIGRKERQVGKALKMWVKLT